MARNGLPGDGTQKSLWHSSIGSVNLKSGSIVLATPRAANDNVPPTVPPIPDQQAIVGHDVTFDVSDASDVDGDTLTFSWTFGDDSTAVGPTPTHRYEKVGTFAGALDVSDGATIIEQRFTVMVSEEVVLTPPSTDHQAQPTLPISASVNKGTVHLNELFPNPVGSDEGEFIELLVVGGDVDVSGWKLADESGTTFTFPNGSLFPDGSFIVVERKNSKIALNNDGDTVTLKSADGSVVDVVTYSEAEEGATYALMSDQWAWTIKPTPGTANELVRLNHPPVAKFSVSGTKRVGDKVVFDASDSTDADGDALTYVWDFGDKKQGKGVVAKHTFAADRQYTAQLTVRDASGAEDIVEKSLTIRPALKSKQSASAAKVKGASTKTTSKNTKSTSTVKPPEIFTGWVSAAPNILGEGLFYVTDGESGIAVRSQDPLPSLKIGDGVSVTGKKGTKSGEPYLAATRATIILTSASKTPVPSLASAGTLDSGDMGKLVRVNGEVVVMSGNRVTIDDGSGEVNAYIRTSTGIKKPQLRTGDHVEVVGIFGNTSGGLRVLPRIKDDIRMIVKAPDPQQSVVQAPRVQKPSMWMYALVAGSLVFGVGMGIWRKQKAAAK
jgi:DNA/RNA endonuclease YhcR with UshA esterase domain